VEVHIDFFIRGSSFSEFGTMKHSRSLGFAIALGQTNENVIEMWRLTQAVMCCRGNRCARSFDLWKSACMMRFSCHYKGTRNVMALCIVSV